MHPPPLLLRRPYSAQLMLAIVVPALFGLITGILLGYSEPAYVVLSLLGILGGIAAGYDHDSAGEGAQRGIIGGSLFGIFILLGGALTGEEATAHLPEPQGVLVVITTVLGVLFGAIGGKLRERTERRDSASTPA